jgi:ATP-dependent helicase/nuclease subunit A
LPFTARFAPQTLQNLLGAALRETNAELFAEDEFVVLQGVVDLAVLLPEEIWLLDFKTDKVEDGHLAEKMAYYAPQLKLYARALEEIYRRPVTACYLHFLSLRKSEPLM